MPHTLAVTVHVDLDLEEVTLAVSGCLTSDTHTSLLPLIAQARGLVPAPRITLDLLNAGHIDLDGLMPLRHQVDPQPGGEFPPVAYRLPDPLPVCRRTMPTVPRDWAGTSSATAAGPGGGAPLTLERGAQGALAGTAVEAPPAPVVAPVTL